VSLEEKALRLRRFISDNPALANVPVMVVYGRPISLSEALSYLESGIYVGEILEGLRNMGFDDPWVLAEAFYRRLATAYPGLRIYGLGAYVPAMSPAEALEHIRRRDEIGEQIVSAYRRLLEFIRMRVDA